MNPAFRARALSELGLAPRWTQRRPATTLAPAEDMPALDCSLAELAERITACQRCSRAVARTRALPGSGPIDARVLVLEALPSAADAAAGSAFADARGRLLEQILYAIGLSRATVYLTYALRCDGAAPEPAQRQACAPYLLRELQLLAPRVVLCFGETLRLSDPWGATLAEQATLVRLPTLAHLLADGAAKAAVWRALYRLRSELASPPA